MKEETPRRLQGRLSISNPSISNPRNSLGENWISIRLQDETSNVEVVAITVSKEEFCSALVGLGHQLCSYEPPRRVDLLGKTAENKTIHVELPKNVPYKDDAFVKLMSKLVKEHEVDGWQADRTTHNGHKVTSKDGKTYHAVIMRRYV